MNHLKILSMMILKIHGWNQSVNHRFLYCFLSFLLLLWDLFALFASETHFVINSESHLASTIAFESAKASITTITWQSNFGEHAEQTCVGKS
jgi:hypothetical protein